MVEWVKSRFGAGLGVELFGSENDFFWILDFGFWRRGEFFWGGCVFLGVREGRCSLECCQ